MKVIDKIVTSISLPKSTNVIWLNPETKEFLVYGTNGWEVWGCLHINDPDLPNEDEEIEFLTIPDNEIWYTTKDNKMYDPIYEGFYNTNIIQKKQEDGFNKWIFNNPITTGTYKNDSTTTKDNYSSTFGICYTGATGVPLASVVLPNTIINIPDYFAYGCEYLLEVSITNNVTTIGQAAFCNCARLRDVYLGKSVQSIEKGAFSGCKCLTNINFPKSLNTIGDSAFEKCNIQKVDLSNVKSIGDYNFIDSSLSYIDIRNCDYVGVGGFPIYSLREADISCKTNFIYSEGNYTKYPFLPTIQTINVHCDSIEEFLNSGISNVIKNIDLNKKIIINNLEVTEIVIPETITSIRENVFYGFDTITSFIVHDNIDFISETAILNTHFYNNKENWDKNSVLYVGNYLLTADKSNVPSVYSIKDGTKIIGAGSLYNCTYLQELYIPKSVTKINYNALDNNKNLKKIIVDEANPNYVSYDNIVYDKNITSFVVVPLSIEGNVTLLEGITSIPSTSFRDCSSLTSISIPNSVTSIGSSAFSSCSKLTSVTIPNSVTSIGYYAFEGCSKLTKTNYTGDIAGWCNIEFDGYYANPMYYSHNFYVNDQEIKDLVIPNTVDSIHGCAFAGCSSLTSVTIPNSVTSVRYAAFQNCSNLTSVTIPNSVTSIGDDAFYKCSGLTSVTIGNGITNIGYRAFGNCSKLTYIVCNAVVPPVLGSSNSSFSNLEAIYVPSESVEAYKTATNWSLYSSKIQAIP